MYGPAKGDVKLLFVPLIFILLRAWTSATDIGLDYVNPAQQITFKCSRAAAALSVLSVCSTMRNTNINFIANKGGGSSYCTRILNMLSRSRARAPSIAHAR